MVSTKRLIGTTLASSLTPPTIASLITAIYFVVLFSTQGGGGDEMVHAMIFPAVIFLVSFLACIFASKVTWK